MQKYLIRILLSIELIISCSCRQKLSLTGSGMDNGRLILFPMANFTPAISYKINLRLWGSHYTGILILKNMGKEKLRVAWVNEIGIKIFEMERMGDTVRTLYCFGPINKERIKSVLLREISQLFPEVLLPKMSGKIKKQGGNYKVNTLCYGQKVSCVLDSTKRNLLRIDYGRFPFNRERVRYSNYSAGMPSLVRLCRRGFGLGIKLQRVENLEEGQ